MFLRILYFTLDDNSAKYSYGVRQLSESPDEIQIKPLTIPVDAVVRPPGSKSITNRALICAALAKGRSTLDGALDSEDTQVMIDGLRSLGLKIKAEDGGQTLHVAGCDGEIPANEANIHVGNSGTTIRFLTALATLGRGSFQLDGIERMRERPIGDLADALNQLGADVKCLSPEHCPPVSIQANGLRGGVVSIRGDISSQYLSGLLMAAPCAEQGVEIKVQGTLVSVPYVTMTLAVMKAFGVEVNTTSDYRTFKVDHRSSYEAIEYAVEPDASAASYFWAAAAIAGGRVKVEGLSRDSLQGDVLFVECLEQMGCKTTWQSDGITVEGGALKGIDVDMNGISDTVQTLAVTALFAEGPTRIRNVGHIRHKETDRIGDLATELRKLGAEVNELEDGLEVAPSEHTSATIDTYNDHRMAMSFAVAGLRIPGIVIRDPGCTAKTYPNFFDDLEELRP